MNGSPLFMHVQRKLGRNLPREVTEDEQAEIAYAFEKLAAGERYVQARHLKVALRAMGFPVKVCSSDVTCRAGLIAMQAPWQARSSGAAVSASAASCLPLHEA